MQKLQNMKIRIKNPEHSKQVQECLFKLGFGWNTDGMNHPKATSFLYLYIHNTGRIGYGETLEYYNRTNFKEVTLEDLQAMLTEHEPPESDFTVPVDIPTFSVDNTINTYMSQIQKRLADVNMTINIYADEIRVANLDNDDEAVVKSWDGVLEVIKVKQDYLNVFKGS